MHDFIEKIVKSPQKALNKLKFIEELRQELKIAEEIIKGKSSKIEILAQLTRLRQICVDPKLFVENYNEMSAKIELAVSLINDLINEGHKVLLFSQFTSVFPTLEEYMDKNKDK